MSKQVSESSKDASQQFQSWLRQQYDIYLQQLLRLLSHRDLRLQLSSLHCCMDFVRISFLENREAGATTNSLLIKVLKAILCTDLSSSFLTEITSTFFRAYDDLRFYFFTHIAHILGSKLIDSDSMEMFLSNLIQVVFVVFYLPNSCTGTVRDAIRWRRRSSLYKFLR